MTMQDLIDQIKVILPNALVVEADDEVVIQTGLVSDLGGLLYPIEREGESMKCNECVREVEVEDGVALCHYHYNNESLAKPGAFYEVKV